MGQLEDILKHQNMVRNNIMKSFGAETSEDSLEKSFEDEVNPFEMEAYKSELTKAELDEFEKAKHQDGDMHPNGKWVWRQSANGGKGDWRVAKTGGSKYTSVGAAASTPSSGGTGTPNASSSYFSKLSNSLIEKYSKKKESVSLSDIEEFYEDFLRDRSQEPTRKVYANEAKKTYDAIVANWHKNDDTKKAPKAAKFMDVLKTVNSKYTDESKVSVMKTPKGNWEVSYDGHVVSTVTSGILSEKVAKDKGWIKDDDNDKNIVSTATYIYTPSKKGKRSVKVSEIGLTRMLNSVKEDTVIIKYTDWSGDLHEATKIAEKIGWSVDFGNINVGKSNTGTYLVFKKKMSKSKS